MITKHPSDAIDLASNAHRQVTERLLHRLEAIPSRPVVYLIDTPVELDEELKFTSIHIVHANEKTVEEVEEALKRQRPSLVLVGESAPRGVVDVIVALGIAVLAVSRDAITLTARAVDRFFSPFETGELVAVR